MPKRYRDAGYSYLRYVTLVIPADQQPFDYRFPLLMEPMSARWRLTTLRDDLHDQVLASIEQGAKLHMVMAGNPILPAGAFFDAFSRGRDLWNCICVDAFDSPNLAGFSLDQLLQMDPSPGGPLDQNPVSYLATRRWAICCGSSDRHYDARAR